MLHHWLLITLSWIGTARLQYINTGGPGADSILDPMVSNHPYPIYFSQPQTLERQTNEPVHYFHDELQRKRRTADEELVYMPNQLDEDKTGYFNTEQVPVPQLDADKTGYSNTEQVPIPLASNDEKQTDEKAEMEKRNFSPWGGKRADPMANIEQMWTWKRDTAIREPSMPKRVRFSPWGGKRSGQMIYKPGTKGSKVIYSTSIPELTRIIPNYFLKGKRFGMAGLQFVPNSGRKYPMKVLALSALLDENTLKDALPFKAFLESLPKNFKPGHPYTNVHLKKDGKRKVKFSAWGGKRSPPIIGPIWTPALQDQKEATLNTIILIRNSPDIDNRVL